MKHLENIPDWICKEGDDNICAYVDTDSNYFNAEPILKHLHPDFESFDNPGAFETVDTPFGNPFQAIADAMSGDDAVSDIGADTSDYTGFGFGEDDGFGMV